MPMVTLVTENAPPRLRGRLSLQLLELRAGVYAGDLHSAARLFLWSIVEAHIENGSAVMCWPDPLNASGIDFKAIGENWRIPVIIDGLLLPKFTEIN